MPESAYFTSIHIENVRCFSDLVLDLTADKVRPARWTLILGDNNVGKTTLLQSIAWTQPWKVKGQGADLAVDPVLFEEENSFLERLLPTNSKGPIRLHATLSVGSQLLSVDEPATDVPAGEKIFTNLSISFGPGRKLANRAKRTKGPAADCLVIAYGADRRPGIHNLETLDLNESSGKRLAEVSELYDIEQLLQELEFAAITRPKDLLDRDRLLKVLTQILPIETDPKTIQIYPTDVLDRGERSGVFVKTFGELVPWSDLSLGYRSTLAWAGDLAWRLLRHFKEFDDPFGQPIIVLIDELDLHLHPRWQLRIMKDLSEIFPRAQFVATSHSPLMAQVAEHANYALLKVRETEGDVAIDNDPEVVKSWRVDQFLTSDLFGNLGARSPETEALFARRDELLSKSSLSAKEKAILSGLEAQIAELPTAEFASDQEAIDYIRQTAVFLKSNHPVA